MERQAGIPTDLPIPDGGARVNSPMLRFLEGSDPFVAFVGAGASALPPSNLPTWTQFNDLLLESLGDRVAVYSAQGQPTGQIVAAFRARRDTGFFSPDFQAQLMEDEIGADYFRVWQSLDTDAFGPVHAAVGELAGRGRLAAVVTTNFDRLIEAALAAAGQPFEVLYDETTFAALSPFGRGPRAALPILKIHGSLEHPASLVDTLKQRVVGRPEPVTQALQALLLAYPWLFLGFSGADFTYQPHYLGVLDAAGDAKGFVFLAREGRPIADGVVQLAKAYGPERATIVHGELEPWLSRTFRLDLEHTFSSTQPDAREETIARIRERIGAWVNTLGPMASINILCSLLRSAGLDGDAFWLLRKTWRSYRSPDDIEGSAYHRYNLNFGRSLLEAGLILNPVARAEDLSNLPEWKEGADQNAFEFLARGYKAGNLVAAGGFLASVLAYRGELGKAVPLAAQATGHWPLMRLSRAATRSTSAMLRSPVLPSMTSSGCSTRRSGGSGSASRWPRGWATSRDARCSRRNSPASSRTAGTSPKRSRPSMRRSGSGPGSRSGRCSWRARRREDAGCPTAERRTRTRFGSSGTSCPSSTNRRTSLWWCGSTSAGRARSRHCSGAAARGSAGSCWTSTGPPCSPATPTSSTARWWSSMSSWTSSSSVTARTCPWPGRSA